MTGRRVMVTGAFSNIGSATARELLARGHDVSTLTNRVPADGDDPRIERHALRFDRDHLIASLRGAQVLVNTYWIRFPHGGATFEHAVERSALLFDAAREAGVERIVHVSVSNASLDSPLAYYSGKARVEEALRAAGPSWSIVRPTLVVGPRDVLTSNIAWFLRRFPAIAVPRGAGYRLQPVLIDDVARLLVERVESVIEDVVDAAGPDVLGFDEYIRVLARSIGRSPKLLRMPPRVMLAALGLAGVPLRDTILTPEELWGLRDELLVSRAPATGESSVVEWLLEHGDRWFGHDYVNDTVSRFDAASA
ncbi:MAG: NAD-dependent epimerase/dehydratase [Thermoleophilia bacterium]|nr:NAD-dependent epimerase/dehydratase [Thermoleophilia bacterium]